MLHTSGIACSPCLTTYYLLVGQNKWKFGVTASWFLATHWTGLATPFWVATEGLRTVAHQDDDTVSTGVNDYHSNVLSEDLWLILKMVSKCASSMFNDTKFRHVKRVVATK